MAKRIRILNRTRWRGCRHCAGLGASLEYYTDAYYCMVPCVRTSRLCLSRPLLYALGYAFESYLLRAQDDVHTRVGVDNA